MESKEIQKEKEGYAAALHEKVSIYKQTLELVKAGNVLEEFIQMKNDLRELREQVSRLKKEIEVIQNDGKQVVDEGENNQDDSLLLEEETVESNPLNNLKESTIVSQPLSYRKLSNLLKTSQNIETNEKEDLTLMNKQRLDSSKNRSEHLPFGMKTTKGEGWSNARSSNKHSIKIRGSKRKVDSVQNVNKERLNINTDQNPSKKKKDNDY